ncbi:hypothetical protein [Sphingomonas zeae]|uniref:Uncharacterized protein n=1 Tax=Sphingomonas zeae TaxID=1646122 RepID=A0A7Y6EFQ7_9SPHN|nr:hypothetical protein [Sphingomonas zeae]MBB4050151.1 hypothetical protein [Sphingomonas zeae]NUU45635.1 hypothetical protein [Sphingomonas zeae]
MFEEEDASDYTSDDNEVVKAVSTTAQIRASWSKQLDRGWHGVKVADWAGLFLPAKLDADIRFLNLLVDKVPSFARVAQRRRRDAVGRLARDQYLLPWTRKSQPQFFVEERAGLEPALKDVEHGFPVAQVQSLVLMALEAGDVEQARKRLVYCWLIPTVHCTNITHRALPGRCEDFDRPLDRYSKRHQKLQELADGEFQGVAMTLRRYDGAPIDPDTYSRAQLLDDLRTIDQLRPIVDGLEGLTFPDPEEEKAYTKRMTDRTRKLDA